MNNMTCFKLYSHLLFITILALSVAYSSAQLFVNKYDNLNDDHTSSGSDKYDNNYTGPESNIPKFFWGTIKTVRKVMCRHFNELCDSNEDQPSVQVNTHDTESTNQCNLKELSDENDSEQFILFEPEEHNEESAKAFIDKLNEQMRKLQHKMTIYSWNSATNLTEYNTRCELLKAVEMAKFSNKTLQAVNKFPWQSFKDPVLRRQFSKFSVGGTEVLPEKEYEEFNECISNMIDVFSKTKVCEYRNPKNCTLSLNPELINIFEKSSDPEELKHYWVSWRYFLKKKCKKNFEKLVKLLSKTAHLNNFNSTKELLMFTYEGREFETDLENLWNDIKPLYEELHAYVRRMLSYEYGADIVPDSGPIPAHLLGDMWAQQWSNIYGKTQPYLNKMPLNIVNERLAKLKSVDLFKLAENFFRSINFPELPDTFYKYSIFEKPKDRDIICHPNAWDFFKKDDYRIKMCAQKKLTDLYTIHHEMGHVYYYMLYSHQPYVFRTGANHAFHEAVGDAIDLSLHPLHLQNIGLFPKTDNITTNYMLEINYLYAVALRGIPLIPWAYIMDLWRWKVYDGEIQNENYNCEWWKLRYDYQGLQPPVMRSEEDFDPPSKFHIAANIPYIRYFMAIFLQYQFHQAMCEKAGLFDPKNPKKRPLHFCNIYKNPAAGDALREMLSAGLSKPWRDTLESFTGQRSINASSLITYFAPLYDWLKEENRRHRIKVGWKDRAPKTGCIPSNGPGNRKQNEER